MAPYAIKQHLLKLQCEDFTAEELIYTDGSKNSDTTGAGIARGDQTVSIGLPKELSIFSAEAYAILRAIKEPASNSLGRVILSDSESVLTAIENNTSSHLWVQEIEKLLICDQKTRLC